MQLDQDRARFVRVPFKGRVLDLARQLAMSVTPARAQHCARIERKIVWSHVSYLLLVRRVPIRK